MKKSANLEKLMLELESVIEGKSIIKPISERRKDFALSQTIATAETALLITTDLWHEIEALFKPNKKSLIKLIKDSKKCASLAKNIMLDLWGIEAELKD